MKNQRIIFMGTPAFAANVLEGLIANEYNVVAVVTQPDKKIGRKQILTPTPVKEVALAHGIQVLQPFKIRNEYQEIIDLQPDLIITSAYGQIIPQALIDAPKFGCINTHGSLLPKYRGGAPIQRAIINGETKTGITIMYMDARMDEGDILYQEELAIDINDTNASLFNKLSDLAKEMLISFLPKLLNGEVNALKQNHDEATYAYNLKKEEEFINFNNDVLSVYNHIRGLLDNPGCYGIIEKDIIKFHKVRLSNEVNAEPSTFCGLSNDSIVIACQNGSILVDEIQIQGKNKLKAKDFMNGSGRKYLNKKFNETL